MFARTFQIFALILLAMLLVACGGNEEPLPTLAPGAGDNTTAQNTDSNNTTTSDTSTDNTTADTGAPADSGLAAGEYSLNISGAVSSGDSYSHERRAGAQFDPFGTGTNAEGPYNVTLRLDGTYNDTPVYIEVNLITNGTLAPGQYTLANTLGNDEDTRAYVEIEDPEGGFASADLADFRDPQGTLTIDAMSLESVSGAAQFTASTDDGEEITVDAAFTEIPFEPDTEIDLTFGGVYEGNEYRSSSQQNMNGNHLLTFLSNSDALIFVTIAPGTEPGTYDVTTADSPITLDDDDVSGTVTLTRADEQYYSGSLDLTFTEDEGDGTVAGTFEYIDVPTAE